MLRAQVGRYPARDLDLDDSGVRRARDALAGGADPALDQVVGLWTGGALEAFPYPLPPSGLQPPFFE